MRTWDNTPIKRCPRCGHGFSLQDFISDPELFPRGMRFADESVERNDYCFEHRAVGCGASFNVSVMLFAPAIDEELPKDVPHQSSDCSKHCFDIEDLAQCSADCLYSPFRRFLIDLRRAKGQANQ